MTALRVFLFTAICGALPALVSVLTTPKLELHAAINAHHNVVADFLFRYGTHLGDGLTATLVALVLLWRVNWRAFLLAGGGVLLSAIVAQLLKRVFFTDVDRPSAFFEEMPGVQLVAGIDLHQHYSFPSGHSASAFSTCLALAIVIGRQGAAFGLAVLACFIAFSRVYLSQHFTEDVLGGAFLGVLGTLAAWWWLNGSSFREKSWLDRSPMRRVAPIQRDPS